MDNAGPPAVCAEIEATGVPFPVAFVNANRAELVDVPPKRRSSVILIGLSAPRFSCMNCVRTLPLLVIVPVQVRFPQALKTVHPVLAPPPPRIISPGPYAPL